MRESKYSVKLTPADSVAAINRIDFGNPDGLYDTHLLAYFLDYDYWRQIALSDKYLVVGRKGTGKSAIYNWIKNHDPFKGEFINNLSFAEFPFERFLTLTDDDFSRPNQYQTIWRNIILTEFASLFLKDQSNPLVDELSEIKKYLEFCFGKDLTDLHKTVTSRLKKTELGIFPNVSLTRSNEVQEELSYESSKLNLINRRLEELMINYRKKYNRNKYFIQFDQLDDNYNYFVDKKRYLESIISLLKIIYKLNQTFKMEGVEMKIIIYLRSDIYNQISALDPESSRWSNYKFDLHWGVDHLDRTNPRLKQLINKRINKILNLKYEAEAFDIVFDADTLQIFENGKRKNPFWYILNRTFDRPRDLIQFCLFIQNESRQKNKLDWFVIREAEKKYSHWFIDEISNEISPDIKNINVLWKFFKSLGGQPFSYKHFSESYIRGKFFSLGMEASDLIDYLYKTGIISNVNFEGRIAQFYSIYRNERSVYDKNNLAVLNRGLLLGLDIYG